MKKKTKLIIAIFVIILLAVWLYLEFHFTVTNHVVSTTDAQEILREVPELALTEDEKELYSYIFTIPIISENINNDSIIDIDYADIRTDIEHIIPGDAEVTSIGIANNNVYIDYTNGETRVILGYYSNNQISKTISNKYTDANKKIVYETFYSVQSDTSQYYKYVPKHVWFGFLQVI